MYVIDQNTLLNKLDIHSDEVSYTDPDYEDADEDPIADDSQDDFESASVAGSPADEEDLDEWGEGLYLCRWPHGEFSRKSGQQTGRARSVG